MIPKAMRSILIILLSVLLLVFVVRSFFSEPELPEVSLPSAPVSSESMHSTNNLGQGQYTAAEVNTDTVQAVGGKTLSRAESYSRTVTVERFWSSGSSSETLECHVRPGEAHIIAVRGTDVKHTLILQDKLCIWYDDSARSFESLPARSVGYDNAVDEFAGILTYEELLNLDSSRISDAGYTVYGGESCIWAQYTNSPLGYVSKVYISISSGLLIGAERYDGQELIYRMSSDAPVIENPDDSWFALPS